MVRGQSVGVRPAVQGRFELRLSFFEFSGRRAMA